MRHWTEKKVGLSFFILGILTSTNGFPKAHHHHSTQGNSIDEFLSNSNVPGVQTPWNSLPAHEEKEHQGRILEWLNKLLFGQPATSSSSWDSSHDESCEDESHHHHHHDMDYEDYHDYHDHDSHGFYPGASSGGHFPLFRNTPDSDAIGPVQKVPHIRNVVVRPEIVIEGRGNFENIQTVPTGPEYNFMDNDIFQDDYPHVRNAVE